MYMYIEAAERRKSNLAMNEFRILPTHSRRLEMEGSGNSMELAPCSLTLIRDHYGDGGVDCDSYMERKRRCMIRSNTTTDNLCDTLLIEIFLRLPIKSAKRCTAVCKRWYALLSDPHFILRFEQGLRNRNKNFAFVFHYHRLWAAKNIVVGSNEPEFKSRGFSLTYLPCCRREHGLVKLPSVVASCNDLLLCCEELRSQEIYYICNPFTQEWVQLPPAPPPRNPVAVGLSCDNSTAASYTVLRIAPLGYSPNLKIDIFSPDTGEWRVNFVSIAPRTFGPLYLFRGSGIPFNGLLFWLIPGQGLLGLDPFDGGQVRHFIDVPDQFHVSMNCGFGVCMGRLRLLQVAKDPVLNMPFIRFWDLERFEESDWVLKKQVYFRDMVGVSKEKNFSWLTEDAPYCLLQVLGCVPDDGDVVHIVAHNQHKHVGKVVSCNLRMGTLEEVCDIPSNDQDDLSQVNTCKLSWHPTPIPTIPSPTGNLSFTTWLWIEEEEEIVYA